MYQVKYKAQVIAPEGSLVKYKPLMQSGIFIPKGKNCKKDKIEKQCIDFITPQFKIPEGMNVEVTIVSIKKLPSAFICCEDK